MPDLNNILGSLLSLDPFGNNLELKTECREVLSLVESRDVNQTGRYMSLIGKLYGFLGKNGILPSQKLP